MIHISIIEYIIKVKSDFDLYEVLNSSDHIKNLPEYEIDIVMGTTEKNTKVLYGLISQT
jgi:hypothetical protein